MALVLYAFKVLTPVVLANSVLNLSYFSPVAITLNSRFLRIVLQENICLNY